MNVDIKNIKCENREELKYLLTFYELDRMPIFYDDIFVGYVTKELRYERGGCRYFDCDQTAIRYAILQIKDYISAFLKFRSDDIISLIVERYSDYKVISEETFSGTYDKIFEQVEYANDHLRYCNGSYYKFKDKTNEKLSKLWYLSISKSRSMDIYYGNGTVD